MIDIFFTKLCKDAQIPKKMTKHSVGYDLFSSNYELICIKPNSLKLIPTGISIQLPIGYEAQIRPRSGLALNNLIGVLNSPGTIDPDYRGEVKVILYNFSDETFSVTPKMRIAQLVVAKYHKANFIMKESLSKSSRSSGGFGHTRV